MYRSCIRVGMPDAHEWLAAAVHEKRDGPLGLVLHNAEINAVRLHRPGLDLAKTMARGKTHGVLDMRVIPHLDPGIVPPIETVPDIAAIIQLNFFFQYRGIRAQQQFDRPLHSVNPVNVAYQGGSAAVRIWMECKVDRRQAYPIMRDGKIEFDTESGPGAAV